MRRWLTRSVHLIVLVLTVPLVLPAQEFRNNELNFFMSGSSFTKKGYLIGSPQSTPPASGTFKLDDTIRGGVRFNVNTTRHWGEEFFFSYEPTTAHFITGTTDRQSDVRVLNFGVNAMYYLYREESRDSTPYFSAGLGGIVFNPTGSPGFASATDLSANYGIGFKRSLSRRFGFRMDLRGFIARQPDFGFPQRSTNPNVTVFPAAGAIHNIEPSAGLYIKLKKKPGALFR